MTLTSKEALEFAERIDRENERKRMERFARAKDAAARGKEPFDLARLETMCATEALGRMSPETRAAQLEEMYYVQYSETLTLADFAAEITELGRW
jgi:hypothetical protein